MGTTPTSFTRAAGTYPQEKILCQHYYVRHNTTNQPVGWTMGNGSAYNRWQIPVPVTMRANPTVSITGNPNLYNNVASGSTISTISGQYSSPNVVSVDGALTSSVGTNGWIYLVYLQTGGNTQYVEVNAELI